MALTSDPPGPSLTVLLALAGGRLPEASSGGGLTQWYGGGGASPSSSGRRVSGLCRPLRAAPAR